MMKSMTDCINCDDAKVASAAFVCVLSCRFASNGRASVPASRHGNVVKACLTCFDTIINTLLTLTA